MATVQSTTGKGTAAQSGGVPLLPSVAALFIGAVVGFLIGRTLIKVLQDHAPVERKGGEERMVPTTERVESHFPV